jgi:serine protease
MRRGSIGVQVRRGFAALSIVLASVAMGPVGASSPAAPTGELPDQPALADEDIDGMVAGVVVHTRTRNDADVAGRRSAALTGVPAEIGSALAGGYRLIEFDEPIPIAQAEAISQRLVAEGLADSADPDYPRYATAAPNDPRYAEQWNLSSLYHGSPAYGIDVEEAWDVTTGSPAVVVAVVDTGILPHPDIDDRLIDGSDMISSPSDARDGDGRDADPFDEGDWCDAPSRNSSWHGLHVAGTLGAEANNGTGVAGIDQQSRIQAVRVLGACGSGSALDVMDAIRWAAGLEVPGTPAIPVNPTPAKVINVSLGGPGPCTAFEQDAIDAAVGAGAVIVVAAGNDAEDLDVTPSAPANCNNVITVAATSRFGDRASYSNFGSTVDIAAPGGERITNLDERILSTVNTGQMPPNLTGSGWTFAQYQGTSMAAPHVSGVVSLMLAADPSLTPGEVLQILRVTAKPFPPSPFDPSFTCSSDPAALFHCGAGIVDAGAAVRAAANLPNPPGPPTSVIADAGGAQASVGWSPPVFDGGSPITQYVVTSSPGGRTCVWTSGPLTCSVLGLANGVPHTFTVVASNAVGAGPPSAPSAPVTPTSGFSAIAPQRVFDTRSGDGGVPATKVQPNTPLRIKITGRNGVPTTGVAAVSINLTVDQPDATGFVTAYRCTDPIPVASNLNHTANQTIANAVIVPVDTNGEICFDTEAPTHLLADINGWFADGGGFSAIAPQRVFDTRSGDGGVPATKVQPHTPLRIKITGRNGVPTTGVAAVSINLTVDQPDATGFVTAYRCTDPIPVASNLNHTANQTIANAVIVPVDTNGEICFDTEAPTHLLADINGWFAS